MKLIKNPFIKTKTKNFRLNKFIFLKLEDFVNNIPIEDKIINKSNYIQIIWRYIQTKFNNEKEKRQLFVS